MNPVVAAAPPPGKRKLGAPVRSVFSRP